ncbi:NADH:ubiquinone oxidoreductase, partial [Coemansia nantahalensis]
MFSSARSSSWVARRAGAHGVQRMSMLSGGGGGGGSGQGKTRVPRLRRLGRVAAGGAVVGVAYLGWRVYHNRNPGEQLPYDPSKRTLVLLGTGWGSTTVLKNLDT